MIGHVITESGFTLGEGMDLAGISFDELYLRYTCLGGNGSEATVRAHLANVDHASHHEHNLVAQALNEVFLERGQDHPIAYRDLYRPQEPDHD